jgi:hypothetical protein
MARLTGEQKKRLHEALRLDFSPHDLRGLFVFYLEMPIDEIISPNDDSRTAALKVITASEGEGLLPGLLRAVADERRGRQDIQDLVAELLATLEAGPTPSANAPVGPAVGRRTKPVIHPKFAPAADPLLITAPIRMELVRVDDGRPLRMGTPSGQVQELVERFEWAKQWDATRGTSRLSSRPVWCERRRSPSVATWSPTRGTRSLSRKPAIRRPKASATGASRRQAKRTTRW